MVRSKLIYITRSDVETRQECERMRFYNTDYNCTGLQRIARALPLINGDAIHKGHARVLAGQSIEEVIPIIREEYRAELLERGMVGIVESDLKRMLDEQCALIEGMLRAWQLKRMPMILADYEILSIEESFFWDLAPGVKERMRLDAILRRKDDGLLHILDYKSLAYPSDDWMRKFERSLQTSLYVQALKERSGEYVGGIIYEGVVKGQWKKDTNSHSPWFGMKIQQSPYCYGYRGPAGELQTDYTAKKGWKKIRVCEEMPMKKWVEEIMAQEAGTLENLFVEIPPISPTPREMESIKRQVVNQEIQWHLEMEEYHRLCDHFGLDSPEASQFLDQVAPQKMGRCYKYGVENECQYVSDLCWTDGASPLEDGGYEPRVSHHEALV